jgi:hypothetical protein
LLLGETYKRLIFKCQSIMMRYEREKRTSCYWVFSLDHTADVNGRHERPPRCHSFVSCKCLHVQQGLSWLVFFDVPGFPGNLFLTSLIADCYVVPLAGFCTRK